MAFVATASKNYYSFYVWGVSADKIIKVPGVRSVDPAVSKTDAFIVGIDFSRPVEDVMESVWELEPDSEIVEGEKLCR